MELEVKETASSGENKFERSETELYAERRSTTGRRDLRGGVEDAQEERERECQSASILLFELPIEPDLYLLSHERWEFRNHLQNLGLEWKRVKKSYLDRAIEVR